MNLAPYPQTDGTAPCQRTDPESYFPERGGSTQELTATKARCRTHCQFLEPCLAYALTNDVSGIWGGTSDDDRSELRRRRGIQAAPLTFAGMPSEQRIATPPGHGNWGGVHHHRNRHEPPCDACRAFATEQTRIGRQKRRQEATA